MLDGFAGYLVGLLFGFQLATKVLVCFGGLLAISSYVRYYVAFVFGVSLVPLDSLCYVGCRNC